LHVGGYNEPDETIPDGKDSRVCLQVWIEEEIYSDDTKYALAVEYASECLKEGIPKNEPDA